MARNFYNIDSFSDPVEARDAFDNAIRRAMDFNNLGGPFFFAKVLNTPIPLNASDMNALIDTQLGRGSSIDATRNIAVIFKGRIEQLHSFLEDPCNEAFAGDAGGGCSVKRLIAQHTDFVSISPTVEIPAAGDIVKVELQPSGIGEGYDLQFGTYIGMQNRAAVPPPGTTSGCFHSYVAFNNNQANATFGNDLGSLGGGSSPIDIPLDILECSGRWDEAAFASSNEEYTSEQAELARNIGILDSYVKTLHADFQPFVKCFLATILYNSAGQPTGWNVNITQAFRSQSTQQRLYSNYVNNKLACAHGATNIKCPPIPAARPGQSMHEYGFAIDVNIQKAGYGMMDSAESKEIWVGSGVVALAEEFGLTWGGHWEGDLYDPIHFEGSGLLGKNSATLRDLSARQGVAGNTVDIP